MFSNFTWSFVGSEADAFVAWLLPVALIVGGLSLGLSLSGFLLAILNRGGSERPSVGKP